MDVSATLVDIDLVIKPVFLKLGKRPVIDLSFAHLIRKRIDQELIAVPVAEKHDGRVHVRHRWTVWRHKGWQRHRVWDVGLKSKQFRVVQTDFRQPSNVRVELGIDGNQVLRVFLDCRFPSPVGPVGDIVVVGIRLQEKFRREKLHGLLSESDDSTFHKTYALQAGAEWVENVGGQGFQRDREDYAADSPRWLSVQSSLPVHDLLSILPGHHHVAARLSELDSLNFRDFSLTTNSTIRTQRGLKDSWRPYCFLRHDSHNAIN